ncbi:MAG: lysophospholipid acyltransferase family protein [Thermodesulfobacteriota bacterium]|nr:lysophospholipid acyltransferase family protein [Thermodesulfobacteriota bacterium]
MNRRDAFLLHLQYLSGRFAIFMTAPLLVLLIKMVGYRVNNLKKHRKDIAALFKEHKGPWIICANHLTLIDSVLLSYVMFPVWRYMLQYRLLAWNLPEKRNFQRNPVMASLCFLLKCIPVVRGGERESIKACFAKCGYFLKRRESIMIFPEGTRSRSGRINTDAFSYGPGRLVDSHPECRVMCLYLRGDRQATYSNIPAPNDHFYFAVSTCEVDRNISGFKAHRAHARKIIGKLAEMEGAYFDTRGQ